MVLEEPDHGLNSSSLVSSSVSSPSPGSTVAVGVVQGTDTIEVARIGLETGVLEFGSSPRQIGDGVDVRIGDQSHRHLPGLLS